MRLVKYWDDGLACDYYKLLADRGISSISNQPKFVADGDEKWAKRTAEHYGIEIEEE
jgi:hypothetical protein